MGELLDLLLEDVMLWEAEEERLIERLKRLEEEMLLMEVDDESQSFN